MVASQLQWLLEVLPLRLRIAGVEYVESSVGVVNCHSLATLFFYLFPAPTRHYLVPNFLSLHLSSLSSSCLESTSDATKGDAEIGRETK